jgi:ABC-type sugar transport system ATPase subunit
VITLEKLTICQGSFSLRDIELSVPSGEYGILMGKTGCGKTTLVEAICGLRRVVSGSVLLQGVDVSRLPASARQIGYVPQDSALFPTMRVDRQIEFGLEVRNIRKREREKRVHELSELLDISTLLRRYPPGLSGGEMQRVALARALSFRPRLLCLDEPLSGLDDSTRNRLAELLREVHRRERITCLHITHNAAEAQDLGTVHFRLEDGRITQF